MDHRHTQRTLLSVKTTLSGLRHGILLAMMAMMAPQIRQKRRVTWGFPILVYNPPCIPIYGPMVCYTPWKAIDYGYNIHENQRYNHRYNRRWTILRNSSFLIGIINQLITSETHLVRYGDRRSSCLQWTSALTGKQKLMKKRFWGFEATKNQGIPTGIVDSIWVNYNELTTSEPWKS